MNTEARAMPLTAAQIATMILFGATLWLAAALLLRWIGTLGAFEGVGRFILYAAVVPGTVPFVWFARALARLSPDQTFAAFSIGTASALLLDGIAVAWFPGLYGSDAGHVTAAAAAVLWGAGVGLFLAFLMNPPAR